MFFVLFTGLTISILALVSITCFLSTNGFAALLHSFNYECISGSDVAFSKIPQNDSLLSADVRRSIDLSSRAINETSHDFHLYYVPKAERKQQLSNPEKVSNIQIYQLLSKEQSDIRQPTTTERSLVPQQPLANEVKDTGIFQSCKYHKIMEFKIFYWNVAHCNANSQTPSPPLTGQIDGNNSQWGDKCSFYYYYPVIELTTAVLWIALLSISGPGDNHTGLWICKTIVFFFLIATQCTFEQCARAMCWPKFHRNRFSIFFFLLRFLSLSCSLSFVSHDFSVYRCLLVSRTQRDLRCSFIHKSWRLVIPSMICFCAMAISCAIYAAYLNNSLNSFCAELRKPFSNNELPCRLLIDRFRLNDDTLLTASVNFRLVKSAAFVRLFLWLSASALMLLRCILTADFQKFDTKHFEQLRRGSLADSDRDNNASHVSFIADVVRDPSQERVYKTTTQQPWIETLLWTKQ